MGRDIPLGNTEADAFARSKTCTVLSNPTYFLLGAPLAGDLVSTVGEPVASLVL